MSLLGQGIARSTSASYHSGIRRYQAFCSHFGLPPLPLSQSTLCRFVAFLHQEGLSPSSIRQYLSSLRFWQISFGGSDPALTDMFQLHYVLRAIRRISPMHSRPTRLPITPSILRHLFSIWSSPPVSYSACMLWAACSLGFSAFLRSGEFTCSSPSAYVPTMLSPMDVAVDNRINPSFLAVTLRSSKIDVFGSGVTVYIGATGGPLCPVAAVLSYLAIRPPVPGPLFVYQGGRPLSRICLVEAVRSALRSAGVEVAWFNGHSFRIGAASTAADVGIPDSMIQMLGRWKSSAFLSYLRTPRDRLTAVTRQLYS